MRGRLAAIAAVIVTGGCSTSPAAPAPGPPQGIVTIVGTEMAFTPARVQLRSGTWTLHFDNRGTVFHDLSIEPSNGSKVIAGTGAQPGQAADLTVTLGRGHYLMLCLEPGHRQAGMTGTIDVS